MKYFVFCMLMMAASLSGLKAQVQERFKTHTADTATTQQDSDVTTDQQLLPGEKERFWDKVVIGGNASASFGSYTFVYLAPSAGYRFNDKLVAGPGFIYQYAKINEIYNYQSMSYQHIDGLESTVYGPKAFVNYFPFGDFFYIGSQFEYLNHGFTSVNVNTGRVNTENIWTPVLFLECGLSSRIGEKGYAQLGLRLNVLDSERSPYSHALFPVVGFFF